MKVELYHRRHNHNKDTNCLLLTTLDLDNVTGLPTVVMYKGKAYLHRDKGKYVQCSHVRIMEGLETHDTAA